MVPEPPDNPFDQDDKALKRLDRGLSKPPRRKKLQTLTPQPLSQLSQLSHLSQLSCRNQNPHIGSEALVPSVPAVPSKEDIPKK